MPIAVFEESPRNFLKAHFKTYKGDVRKTPPNTPFVSNSFLASSWWCELKMMESNASDKDFLCKHSTGPSDKAISPFFFPPPAHLPLFIFFRSFPLFIFTQNPATICGNDEKSAKTGLDQTRLILQIKG